MPNKLYKMSDLLQKIDFKKVVYAVVFGSVAIYLFITFTSNNKGKSELHGSVIIKDEKPKNREFFSSYKPDAQATANKSTVITDDDFSDLISSRDYSSQTDDKDVDDLQEMLRRQRALTNYQEPPKTNREHTIQQAQAVPQEPVNKLNATYEISVAIDDIKKEQEPEQATVNRFSNTTRRTVNTNVVSVATLREQTVSNGSSLRLITQEVLKAGGTTIPPKTILTGVVQFSEERIQVFIADAVINGNVIPVNMHVYDMDGLKGIATAVNVESLNAGEIVEQARASIPLGGVLGTGVNAATNAVRAIFNKNTSRYDITIRANYKLYLK